VIESGRREGIFCSAGHSGWPLATVREVEAAGFKLVAEGSF